MDTSSIADAATADEPAFATLFAEYAPRVRALGCRRAGPDLADDIVQETFLRAYRAYGRYVDEGKSWAWIRRIAEHVCIDLHRRSSVEGAVLGARCATTDEEAISPATDVDETFGSVAAREERGAVVTVLAGLNPRHRRVLVLRELGGWSHRDIAAADGMTIDGVKATLKRARSAFRSAYEVHAGHTGGLGAALGALGAVRRQLRRVWSLMEPAGQVPAVLAGVAAAVALSFVIATGAVGTDDRDGDGTRSLATGPANDRLASEVERAVAIAAWRPAAPDGVRIVEDDRAHGVDSAAVDATTPGGTRVAGSDGDEDEASTQATTTAPTPGGGDVDDGDDPDPLGGLLPFGFKDSDPPDVYDDNQTCWFVPSTHPGTMLCVINVIDVRGLKNTTTSSPETPAPTPSTVMHDADDSTGASAGDATSEPAPAPAPATVDPVATAVDELAEDVTLVT